MYGGLGVADAERAAADLPAVQEAQRVHRTTSQKAKQLIQQAGADRDAKVDGLGPEPRDVAEADEYLQDQLEQDRLQARS